MIYWLSEVQFNFRHDLNSFPGLNKNRWFKLVIELLLNILSWNKRLFVFWVALSFITYKFICEFKCKLQIYLCYCLLMKPLFNHKYNILFILTRVFWVAYREWTSLDLLLEQILLIEEEDDGCVCEPLVVADAVKKLHALMHTVLWTHQDKHMTQRLLHLVHIWLDHCLVWQLRAEICIWIKKCSVPCWN